MNKLNEKNAITLIALVITIVVLLVLAGVVINLSTGKNGIIGKAQTASGVYQNVQENDESALAKYEIEIDNFSRGTVTLTQEQFNDLYSTPDGKLKDMPNTWNVGTEYCWGNGNNKIYGQRYYGSFSPVTATRNVVTIDTSTEAREVIAFGGRVGDFVMPFSNIYITTSTGMIDCGAFLTGQGKMFMFKSSSTPTNSTYDIWVLYKK